MSWFCDNLIEIISIITTTILTCFIIFQNINTRKKQIDFEKRIHEEEKLLQEKVTRQQNELQKRHLQLASYPYKREVYINVNKVLSFVNGLKRSLEFDVWKKNGDKLFGLYENLKNLYAPDPDEILWSLYESMYILPSEVNEPVMKIREAYDSLCAWIIPLPSLSNVFDDKDQEEYMEKVIQGVEKKCDEIILYGNIVNSTMLFELNIAGISK